MNVFDFIKLMLGAAVCVCLLVAAIMDGRTTYVYRFIWWIAGGCGALLLGLKQKNGINIEDIFVLLGLVAFVTLQFTVCRSWYGLADVKAFCCCATFAAALGRNLIFFLEHMILSYVFLGAVQLVRGNVGKGAGLKKQVAFIPYIVGALGVMFIMTGREH